MKALHNRPHLRLPHYDYSLPGAYFITLSTVGGHCLFGKIVEGRMELSEWGRIVDEEWLRSAELREEIEMDAFVVMPNHLHGIVWIKDTVHANGSLLGNLLAHEEANGRLHVQPSRSPRSRRGLASFIAGFKAYTSKRINEAQKTPGATIWHANYFEHVIRSEKALAKIREYIVNNPIKWHFDKMNPANAKQA